MPDFGSRKGFHKPAWTNAYRKTEKGKAVHKRTEHATRTAEARKEERTRAYLSRTIVGVDGEGINIRTGPRKGAHDYILLALSGVEPIVNDGPGGLTTKQCLDYLFNNLDPKDLNVIYGGGYDFNMWVRDLNADQLRQLYHSGFLSKPVVFAGYALKWMKGKQFEIAKWNSFGKEKGVIIYDVVSFFQTPFVDACDKYLGDYENRDVLVREKARRGVFSASEIVNIGAYNNLELDLLVRLVDQLRADLDFIGLRPKRWNGPGAIAATLFSREGVRDALDKHIPEAVARAARFAYAGGRFEMLKYGSVHEKVYEYDINSAYPRALLEVPNLQEGHWLHRHGNPGSIAGFGVYRVRYSGTRVDIPGPIHYRAENGTISYPLEVENWVWSPEARVLGDYCEQTGASYEILEAWEFVSTAGSRPFHFLQGLYDQRQTYKAQGIGAEKAVKTTLASVYGKCAQQVGWVAATEEHELRTPPYHQLEWAGYVTSWCRAHVLSAALQDLEAVIAFETDALFTSRPLQLDTGTGLGQWELTEFDSLTYVQSGHYYATASEGFYKPKDGPEVIKCRGIDKGFISRARVEKLVGLPESERFLSASLTRFYGAGIALARDLDRYWRKWITEPKVMALTPTGKRLHGGDCCDDTRGPLALGHWHKTYCPVSGGVSHEYPVDWINPNPDMTELSIARDSEVDYE